jgi:hypothetical protein
MAITLPVSTQAEKIAALTTAYYMLTHCGEFDLSLEDGATVPDVFKDAQCEQALWILLNPDWEARMALIAQGVSSAGVVSESYNKIIAELIPQTVPIAPMARAMLTVYIEAESTVLAYMPVLDET